MLFYLKCWRYTICDIYSKNANQKMLQQKMFATKSRLQRNIPEYRFFNMWQKWHVRPEGSLQIIFVTNKSRNLVSYYQVSNYKISNYRKIKTPTTLVCVFDPISSMKIPKTMNFQIFGKGFGRGNVEFLQSHWLQLDLASHWLMDLQADHWQALISMILKEFRKCFDVLKEWIDRFLVEDSTEDCLHLKIVLEKLKFLHYRISFGRNRGEFMFFSFYLRRRAIRWGEFFGFRGVFGILIGPFSVLDELRRCKYTFGTSHMLKININQNIISLMREHLSFRGSNLDTKGLSWLWIKIFRFSRFTPSLKLLEISTGCLLIVLIVILVFLAQKPNIPNPRYSGPRLLVHK